MTRRHPGSWLPAGTHGEVLELLRGPGRTVDDLAAALGLTGNAVRSHLAALERDGLVQVTGRRPSGRRPARIYGLTREAGQLLSRAYLPLLRAILDALGDRLSLAERTATMREVGRRLARGVPRGTGTRQQRASAAAEVLRGLGGTVQVTSSRRGTVIHGREGSACPLAEVVESHPEVCQAVEILVSAAAGTAVEETCDRSGVPRCRFKVG
ncbi:MAG TPA: winged helix-turn-helix transcriptional regulator [Gemmatimonadales bacterium]|jgi:predicted ArsR family transcriptional regulator